MDTATLIPVLTDADISCAASAVPTVVYGQPIPFIHKAVKLNTFGEVYFIKAATTTIRVWAQWSVDGVTWADFLTDLLSANSEGMARAAENAEITYYGPLVRFNVSIVNSTNPSAVRLTVVVNVRFQS